jgi:hypothetical protein
MCVLKDAEGTAQFAGSIFNNFTIQKSGQKCGRNSEAGFHLQYKLCNMYVKALNSLHCDHKCFENTQYCLKIVKVVYIPKNMVHL